ncbi:MAG: sulfatase-like hydrolase/transferase [Candidatus Eisenbacteria bacterium]|nr:sulfatase-like hydrolase/transferase [Candidatus Eisenbacteria bacterium]
MRASSPVGSIGPHGWSLDEHGPGAACSCSRSRWPGARRCRREIVVAGVAAAAVRRRRESLLPQEAAPSTVRRARPGAGHQGEGMGASRRTSGGLLSVVAVLIAGAAIGLLTLVIESSQLRFGSISAGAWLPAALLHAALGAGAALLLMALLRLLRARGRWLTSGTLLLVAVAAVVFGAWNVRDHCSVVLLVSDATRADHMSLYGYERETTPRLDELADECVIWEQMMAVGASTIVSTPTILTALYPTQHGLRGYRQVLADSVRSIAHHLRDAGYATYGHTTNPHLKARQGFARAFDRYNERGGWNTNADLVFGTYFQWYLSQEPGRPTLAFLFTIDPHAPYTPPEEYRTLFDPEWEGLPISSPQAMRWKAEGVDPRSKQNLIAQYDGEIAFHDACVGDFLSGLRNLGRLDETLFVYTSDHGEEFFDHGSFGHNKALYEESIWVPFVIRFPSPLRLPDVAPRGVRVPTLANHIDILPTLLDYLRFSHVRAPNGRSLLPTIGETEIDPESWVYCEQIMGISGPYELYAVRTPEWKLIRTIIYEQEGSRPDELYRLVEDPGEQENVTGRYPAALRSLADRMESMMAMLKLGAPDSLMEAPLDEETRRSLKSLGYIK